MSILDTIIGSTEKHPDVSKEQHSSLVQSALQMFGNHNEISSLHQNAQAHGLGHIVQSWIGNGANQPIAESQVAGLVGEDRVNQLASRAGVSHSQATSALSRILPTIVDKLTPQGKLPKAA
ncbi:MAG TPA: YidB family protein [Candidatus Angelobacter sp.]|nr:YidB family protein [Candidatus Angelobacter sp.]